MPLQIIRNDITKMRVDAIVNAAKESLLGGGGVDGAIHLAAGPRLLKECQKLGGCPTGEARLTKAYDLPAKYVIHTVGPIWQGGENGEPELLRSCYQNSLKLAEKKHCKSVAFPLISSGIYGYPKEQALQIAVSVIGEFLLDHEIMVYLVVFDRRAVQLSHSLYAEIREFIDDHYVQEHSDPLRRRMEMANSLYHYQAGEDGRGTSAPPVETGAFSEDWEEDWEENWEENWDAEKSIGSLNEFLSHRDESFSEMLLRKIDESGMKDSECYKKANIDRKLFSKIRKQTDYHPKKQTVLAFAIALELSKEELDELLMKAGYAMSHSSKFDMIVEYFVQKQNYDIFEINEALFAFDQPLLGS